MSVLQIGTLAYETEAQRIEEMIERQQSLSPTEKIFYRDFLLLEWDEAKKELEKAKAEEMSLRKQVVHLAFDTTKLSGTERVPLYNGYELKGVKKLNYGFIHNAEDKVDKARIDNALTLIEKADPNGAFIAERLVKWTPELSKTEYNQLSKPLKTIIDAVIVTSEGAPTLEIVAPKGAK